MGHKDDRGKWHCTNKAMERKLNGNNTEGEECAVDVRSVGKKVDGHVGVYKLKTFEDGKDYCDALTEEWIWSIGRRRMNLRRDGTAALDGEVIGDIFAATDTTDTRFYQHPDYECLFLR